MYHMHCPVLRQWLSSTLHTLPFSLLCFWYSQPSDSSYQAFHCQFLHLFWLQPLYMEWPCLPLQKKCSLDSIKSNLKTFVFRNNKPAPFSPFMPLFSFAISPVPYMFKLFLSCVQCTCVWGCLCVCVCVCACLQWSLWTQFCALEISIMNANNVILVCQHLQ